MARRGRALYQIQVQCTKIEGKFTCLSSIFFHHVSNLLRSIIEGFCDPALLAAARNAPGDGVAVRPLVKHVADIVWNTLTKGQYKDRPHIQSIYSYLTGMYAMGGRPVKTLTSVSIRLQYTPHILKHILKQH